MRVETQGPLLADEDYDLPRVYVAWLRSGAFDAVCIWSVACHQMASPLARGGLTESRRNLFQNILDALFQSVFGRSNRLLPNKATTRWLVTRTNGAPSHTTQ